MKLIGSYTNGNSRVHIYDDGTKIRETDDDEFNEVFPENIDLKITNRCDMGCPMCHENSYEKGAHGDINAKFVETLRPYTECACLDGNTYVFNNNGAVKIKDLSVGDSIFDESHTLRRIVKITKIYKDAYLLKGDKGFRTICSNDHPFISNGVQVAAKDMLGKRIDMLSLDNNDYGKELLIFDASNYINIRNKEKTGSRSGRCRRNLVKFSSSGNVIPQYTQLTEDLMWLYGLFVAEGSTKGVTLNINEDEYINKTVRIWKENFWDYAHVRKNYEKHSADVELASPRTIKALFIDYFKVGKGARNKNIDFLFSINDKSLIKSALYGLFDGDGCYRIRKIKGRIFHVAELKTTSERMAYEVAYILARHFGIYASVFYGESPKRKIENRYIPQTDYYSVEIYGDQAVSFFGEERFIQSSYKHNSSYKLPKIRDISFISKKELYDITLEDGSHVFPINGYFLTHNCGGGNVLSHPDFIPLLKKLKEQKVIANATLNQIHFMSNLNLVRELINQNLIHGIGVSLTDPTDEFIKTIQTFKNAVIHVINGVVTYGQLERLADKDLKLLILGYKDFRRGVDYKQAAESYIKANQVNLKVYLKSFIPRFKVVSFDNLAIEQLDVRSLMSEEKWNEFYMGDDGCHTMYIDLVTGTFAKNSVAPLDQRYKLMDSIDEMFAKVKEMKS